MIVGKNIRYENGFLPNGELMKSLEVSQDFPDEQYPSRGLFIKQAVDAVFNIGIDVEMISPRAYVIPHRFFPNYKFSKLPKKKFDKYWTHYPRYIYWIPKRYLYKFTGPSYSFFKNHLNYI